MTLFFMCDKILGEKYWDIAKSVRHKTLTLAFRWFESSYPSHDVRFVSTCTKGNEKTGDFERFLPFFRPCIFSEFHRSLLLFSMLYPDSDI